MELTSQRKLSAEECDPSSSDFLISDNTTFTQYRRKDADKLRIALCITLLLSFTFAATAVFLLVTSCQTSLRNWDDEDSKLGAGALQAANSIRIVASKHTAKVIVMRLPLPTIELDLAFSLNNEYQGSSVPESCESDDSSALQCIAWPSSEARLTLSELDVSGAECFNISLSGPKSASMCLLLSGKQLYGGPTVAEQHWPAQTTKPLRNVTYLSGYDGITAVAERFWVTSDGEALYVPPDVSLFVTQDDNQLCLESRLDAPYHRQGATKVTLNAVLCGAADAKQVYLATARSLLGTPTKLPDERMLRYPVWSTWAKFKTHIDQQTVVAFAQNITRFGFPNSQLEIDDRWENCYGEREFDQVTFPNATEMVKTLHQLGFRVTLWIHPFENSNCSSYVIARDLDLLVRRPEDNATDEVFWWNGRAGLLDFTNPSTVEWYIKSVASLREKYNIDGFKCDSGEAVFVPKLAMLNGPEELQPGSITTSYAKAVVQLDPNNLAEMHTLFKSQSLPIVLRMNDKDSVWGYNNGLQALIPVLLTLNMVGYSTIMPDMIGGNGYNEQYPDKELFIRWLQANTFMPIMQFSYSPWDFDDETVRIAKKYVDLHANYSSVILDLARRKTVDGSPINPPIWWLAPNDTVAQSIDSEFLLGDRLLVAPVLQKGAVSRDVYLPVGLWREGMRPEKSPVRGPVWLRNLSAPLDYLPYFERVESDDVDVLAL